jgi:hypothetical protein
MYIRVAVFLSLLGTRLLIYVCFNMLLFCLLATDTIPLTWVAYTVRILFSYLFVWHYNVRPVTFVLYTREQLVSYVCVCVCVCIAR